MLAMELHLVYPVHGREPNVVQLYACISGECCVLRLHAGSHGVLVHMLVVCRQVGRFSALGGNGVQLVRHEACSRMLHTHPSTA